MQEKRFYAKCFSCGPGGMKCPCCGPAPGKDRKAFLRRAKRSQKSEFNRLAQEEIKGE